MLIPKKTWNLLIGNERATLRLTNFILKRIRDEMLLEHLYNINSNKFPKVVKVA